MDHFALVVDLFPARFTRHSTPGFAQQLVERKTQADRLYGQQVPIRHDLVRL
jgi:hypothetical protein